MRKTLRALTGIEIFFSAMSIGQQGVRPWNAASMIFSVSLMGACLLADGHIGTWREEKDKEASLKRRKLINNRRQVMEIMLHPIRQDLIFAADQGKKRERSRK